MHKIFHYELRRLLWNKFFFGLLAVTLFYAYQVFTGEIILGVAHTAPFSPWSFGCYLSRLLPLLWVSELFFLSFFTAGRERRVAVLTGATPVRPRAYAWTRCAAVLVAAAVQVIAVLLLAAGLYGRLFSWYRWDTLILPIAVTLLPPMLLALGSGWLLGRVQGALVYVWMLLPFVLNLLPLPQALGLWNGSLFSEYPLCLCRLDPRLHTAGCRLGRAGGISAPGDSVFGDLYWKKPIKKPLAAGPGALFMQN